LPVAGEGLDYHVAFPGYKEDFGWLVVEFDCDEVTSILVGLEHLNVFVVVTLDLDGVVGVEVFVAVVVAGSD
jgi:hypothetical protein